MDPKKKLEVLEGSFDSGVIGKEEYDKWKEKLEPDVKEFDRKVEEMGKEEQNPEEQPKSSEKALIISIAVIAILFAAIFTYSIFSKEQPKTLEELHVLNLKGKLKPEQGYVYKGVYSFVKFDNFWYTGLNSPKGTKTYSMNFRYSPNELKDIVIEGSLDRDFFNSKNEFYPTFNPTGNELTHVQLAIADFDTHLAKVFEKNPIGSCDRNETQICKSRPIVTCDDKDKLVLYVKESEKFRAYYNGNCIVVEGKGFDLVKGVDRILYNLYNIMGQEEE
ncbi:hypothetical protein J4204_01090 [Candidatus Woesearchaeota archaeon]|nr:hypothetical protein [Candidatus Woesearchaeota archaeon]